MILQKLLTNGEEKKFTDYAFEYDLKGNANALNDPVWDKSTSPLFISSLYQKLILFSEDPGCPDNWIVGGPKNKENHIVVQVFSIYLLIPHNIN